MGTDHCLICADQLPERAFLMKFKGFDEEEGFFKAFELFEENSKITLKARKQTLFLLSGFHKVCNGFR